jgi:integrase
MNNNDAALLRGWIQGVAWDVLGELYLEDAERTEVMRFVRQLRKSLAAKAVRLGLDDDARLWEQEREYTQNWPQRALRSFNQLNALPDPIPQPGDPIRRWLPADIAARLSAAKAASLQELADFINARGGNWWKTVPRLGQQSAEVIHEFFASSEPALGIKLDLSRRNPLTVDRQTRSHGIAPLERFAPPEHLSGETGSNRAPVERCRIEARNDYEAIGAWLSLWDEGTATHRAYRKEAERFLLWAVIEQGKSLSSLTTPDCAGYRRFLADPQPAERWIGKPAQRWSGAWRPLQGPLKPSSIRQAEVILSALCEWLVGQRYLDSNPFSGLSTQAFGRRNQGADRALSPALWSQINAFAAGKAGDPALTDNQRALYRRTAFVLAFAYATGLRLQELVQATVGDLRPVSTPLGEQWWLDVVGKGKKYREVPISPDIMAGINAHLRDRGLKAIGYITADTPIIGKLRGDAKAMISTSGLYQTLKGFFKEAAGSLAHADPVAAERLQQASTHWLRHTHGSHAVANGVPLAIVRDNLGHSNIATTSIYVHTDRDERYKAMIQMTSSAGLVEKTD